MRPKYLTKSRFKKALECPTKLFYTAKKDQYADNSYANDFLMALAKGGYQVGELAKCYYPGGVDVESLDYDEALKQTEELLSKDNVIIYEAAFQYGNLFVRVDVLRKTGNILHMIEVKSKSYYSVEEFYTRNGLKAEWKPYLYDVAFQKYVVANSHPEFKVQGYLMLANKNVNATVDGLYKKFLIHEDGSGRISVTAKDTGTLGDAILTTENVDTIVETIWSGTEELGDESLTFDEYVHALEEAYLLDKKIEVGISSSCKGCEYRLSEAEVDGLKSGFHECWTAMTPLKLEDLQKPTVLDIWYGNSKKFFGEGIYLQEDLDPESIGSVKSNGQPGMQRVERQQIQVIKSTNDDNSIHLLADELRDEMAQVRYPLHMIDFETTAVPIPFHVGTRPFEQHAFQFSHHIIEKNGTVRHATEWINDVPGKFPNFEFVRALRNALSGDGGSVFRYSHHENTILNAIRRQLVVSDEPDADRLIKFIDSITRRTEGTGKKAIEYTGQRCMIDLCDWVIKYYYDPETNGSNSLKAILPSILNRSSKLQEKYSKPIYGIDIPSLNYKGHTWVQFEGGKIISPYKLLPRLWDRFDRNEVDQLINPNDDLEDGGAAMTAYNYMQFDEMSDLERRATIFSLLHYCELDTLAMVMLWEGLEDFN